MGAARRHVSADTGSTVGGYTLGKRLGAGGMGVVYEANPEGGEAVAIKLLYTETLEDDGARRRFHDEGVAASIVRHPNVVSVIERGETDEGVPYLVMEQVRGERLGLSLARGVISLKRAAVVVRQLLAGLDALHAAGIVHGDVKSDNLLLETGPGGAEIATLIDFGLAHPEFLREAPQGEVTGGELVSGTPDYMAPEVIRGQGSSTASDIYSAGVVLYELITGTTPFSGGSPSEVIRRHLNEDVIPPSLRRPDRDIPPILERIVLHALEKDPALRFSSAAAFSAALAVALPTLDDTPSPASSGTFSANADTLDWAVQAPPQPRPRRRIARGTPVHRRRTRRR